jgi:hypothetical protein
VEGDDFNSLSDENKLRVTACTILIKRGEQGLRDMLDTATEIFLATVAAEPGVPAEDCADSAETAMANLEEIIAQAHKDAFWLNRQLN